ncbi:MAG: hypothetical protein LBT48_01635 [Prevotellaceae bacterium]|nr:hypothetical protein [Prevotellaceae bacterium]
MQKYIIYSGMALLLLAACTPPADTDDMPLEALAAHFQSPPTAYAPCVWWHWMGSNFSKEGITKDLEAMKEAGIGGAAVFNIASSVQTTHAPMENNPWATQTFRSDAYWDALAFAASEAKRLGLKIGLHATPGYATTGGPWISEAQGMQKIVVWKTEVAGNRLVVQQLEKPELPTYKGYGTSNKQATYYADVAVMAIPGKQPVTVADVVDISAYMDSTGLLQWQAPEGVWQVYRIGHAPTMANPHPLPDDIIGKALEVDKMSREHNVYHWQQVLNPLTAHLKEYIGDSFTFVWVDSYEAETQDWTAHFRDDFIRMKGYDPLPYIALQQLANDRDDLKAFHEDYKAVVNRLFIDNGWQTAKEMIHAAGLKFYWEPYYSPQFDTYECVSIPDVPVEEFWTSGNGHIGPRIPKAAHAFGKRIVAAEAYTGDPTRSRYTEDPAFLKRSTDGAFVTGVNWLFLHHWVHQPFDDRYQPGMGMGWWGTHFGRHQTWLKPSKAFFSYLARCQMLLQQGEFVSFGKDVLHRQTTDAELFFVINADTAQVRRLALPVQGIASLKACAEGGVTPTDCSSPEMARLVPPELWNADKGTIAVMTDWEIRGDTIYANLKLEKDESAFLVFPTHEGKYEKLPPVEVVGETAYDITGTWNVAFQPKLAQPFDMEIPSLSDFSAHADTAVKYFAGTAVYKKYIPITADMLGEHTQVVLDLGEMHDIAEIAVNGKAAGVLWYPPYRAVVTPWLTAGDNVITVAVTTNWANRLIGDEQYPADFEFGKDYGIDIGRPMKAFPEWFIKNEPRPQAGRKTFNSWYYYRHDSPLQPAGLLGPVQLRVQKVR